MRCRHSSLAKQQHMRFRLKDIEVDPAIALSDTQSSPLVFKQQAAFWDGSEQFFSESDLPVLVVVVYELLRVAEFLREVKHFLY